MIFGVLETLDTMNALRALAILCGTWEEMIFAFALISNSYVWQEAVHCGMPSFTDLRYETN